VDKLNLPKGWIVKDYWFRGKKKRYFLKYKKDCEFCRKEFMARLERDKYCSVICHQKSQRKRVKVVCINCQKQYSVIPSHVSNHTFCGIVCKGEWQKTNLIGDKNPHWGNGSFVRPDGYRAIRVKDRYKMEHVLIVEREIGRELKEGEVVHHQNHNKLDNRIENLQLMNIGDHSRHHNKLNSWSRIFDDCQSCGRTTIAYCGLGLCTSCHRRAVIES
jgi:hypothetical protein